MGAAKLEGPSLGWNAQSITGSYERTRKGREVGQFADGFRATVSKTIAVPVDELYDAFVLPARRAPWLPDGDLHERTATRPKSARFDWGDDGTRLHVRRSRPRAAAATTAAPSSTARLR